MPDLLIFNDETFPAEFKCQVLSFLRVHYWQGFIGENRLRDWITDPRFHPLHFVLVEGGLVISHAEVVWKTVEHNGETYLTYGLTSVLTFPSFRSQGYGTQIVQAASDGITDQGADIALFHCDHSLKHFYEACGWTAMQNTITYLGPRECPEISDELLMMRFLSPKGRAARSAFEQYPLYFGEGHYTW